MTLYASGAVDEPTGRPVTPTNSTAGTSPTNQLSISHSARRSTDRGGYFGGCLAALDDCLRGDFGYTAPATLLWRDAATARKHLSHALTPDGQPYDLFAAALEALAEGGMDVTLA
ncbi:Barstar (barnase inhibitor) [Streptomyces indicus]|uniref:Barstar (Barnase inhibitor) n=1 Tax=Streptomyces indicus TaxID=417292 RepID=A0A1G9GHJ0_9ACTN|nr:Barstar (barnase inhibitor) [Streptomyces indicus]